MHGNYLPPNPLAECVGRTALKLMGWRIEGELPRLDKFVAIGAHHTSNWDFVIFIALKFVLRLNARWFGKHAIFRWPFGGLMRSWGGIPIQRHLSLNMVEQAIQGFQGNREFILVLSPEGTRRKVERWKMGFYHIALGAGVPIVPGALDFANRRVVIGPPFQPTGDAEADLKALLAFFLPYEPKKPHYAFHGD
jgi:1-acyl-sn-glycerol-3-phosphate acyltransferase